jgi:hypothetical protein
MEVPMIYKRFYILGLSLLLWAQATHPMEMDNNKTQKSEETSENKQDSKIKFKDFAKKLNTYVKLRTLLTRALDITLGVALEDKDLSWREIFINLNDSIQNDKLQELDKLYIDAEKLQVLRVKLGTNAPITKEDVLTALKINKLPELFGYDPDKVLVYLNLEKVCDILLTHYLNKENKSRLDVALIDPTVINLELLPGLLGTYQPELLTKYFHVGKLFRVIVEDYVKGNITDKDIVAALKVESFLDMLGIDASKLGQYVDTNLFTLALLRLGNAYMQDELNRKKLQEVASTFLNITECARLLKQDPKKFEQYFNRKECEEVRRKLFEKKEKITKKEFIEIFNFITIRKELGISFQTIEEYFNSFDELVIVINELALTDNKVKREQLLKAFNITKIDNDLGLEPGTIEAILDPRVPTNVQQQKLNTLLSRFSLEDATQIHKDGMIFCSALALSSFGQAIICLVCPENYTFATNLSLTLIHGICAYKWYQNKPHNSLQAAHFNSFIPRIVQNWTVIPRIIDSILGVQSLGLEMIDPNHSLYKEFTTFADSLTPAQAKALQPLHILGLAQYNPTLLTTQEAFINKLQNEAPEALSQLWRIIEKAAILKKLDTELTNFASYWTFIDSLNGLQLADGYRSGAAQIRRITTQVLVDGQKNPRQLLDNQQVMQELSPEQQQLLRNVVARTEAFNKLDQKYASFSTYTSFLSLLSDNQLSLIAEATLINAQRNPHLLQQNAGFMATLNEEQKTALTELCKE